MAGIIVVMFMICLKMSLLHKLEQTFIDPTVLQ